MASSFTGIRSLGFFFGVLSCFSLVLQNGSANNAPLPPVAPSGGMKVSELSRPTSGLLGLSPLIEPLQQNITLSVDYPRSTYNPFKDHTSYEAMARIQFRCTEPTSRIVTHGNPEWVYKSVAVYVFDSNEQLTIKEILFNPADETLYVDMLESLETEGTYELRIILGYHIIDQDDRFGIQAFNYTPEGSSSAAITTSLSGAPKVMRRLVPCFDDPTYKIPYRWNIYAVYGIYSPAIAMLNGPRDPYNSHVCGMDPFFRFSQYGFTLPAMAIGATQIRIVPFTWYPEQDLVRPPPEHCVDLFVEAVDMHPVCARAQDQYAGFDRGTSGSGCWSFVGRQGGVQQVNLQYDGCIYAGIIAHELIHAIGYFHEQSRTDRDSFVMIRWENIQQGTESNFDKYPATQVNPNGVFYDYESIMHYSAYAFSKNNLPTIDPISVPRSVLGQRSNLSAKDAQKMNNMYKGICQ